MAYKGLFDSAGRVCERYLWWPMKEPQVSQKQLVAVSPIVQFDTTQTQSYSIPRKDLSTKKTKPSIEKWPESLGVRLEF